MPSPRNFFSEFEFDLPGALLRDLTKLLDGMGSAALETITIEADIPEEQGIYQLFLDDTLVYIGKTDSDAGLKRRLLRHAQKIKHREMLDPARVTFKAVRIFVFTAVDLEQLLIRHYKTQDEKLDWNNSGFGANDPGRERDTTVLKDGHFDVLYPINIDVPLKAFTETGEFTVATVLAKLKNEVPYVIRFENNGGRSRNPHSDLETTPVSIPAADQTARNILQLVQNSLGDDWQVTVLPGYVIIYKEKRKYPHARLLIAS